MKTCNSIPENIQKKSGRVSSTSPQAQAILEAIIPGTSSNGHGNETKHSASIPLSAVVDTFTVLAVVFCDILLSTVRVVGATACSTVVILGCIFRADLAILGQVLDIWVLFGHHVSTALRFAGWVVLLRTLSAITDAVRFLCGNEPRLNTAG